MKKFYPLLLLSLLLFSCSPTQKLTVTRPMSSLDENTPVLVFAVNEPAPLGGVMIGTIQTGDSGFSVNCGYDAVIEMSKRLARQSGGNVLKITRHKTPSALGSTCHRITADIIYLSDDELTAHLGRNEAEQFDPELYKQDCAVIHFYRFGGMGAAISYNISIGDDVLTRVTNNYRESIMVPAVGMVTLVARTEAKTELPVLLMPGHHYYVRCSVEMGVAVGRPRLELVSPGTGRVEYEAVKVKDKK